MLKRTDRWNYILWLLTLLVFPAAGRAGNTRAFFLGDEASMTGGAGIAVTRDSGSIWYNPAGLGGLSRGRMELSATAFKLKLRHIDKFVEAELPGGSVQRDMNINSFGSVPTAVVFVRKLNDAISFGLAIHQTGNLVESVRIEMNEPFRSGRWRLGVENHDQEFTYHVGPGVGWQIADRFRIGLSLFVVYHSETSNEQEFLSLSLEDSSGTNNYAYLWSNYYDVIAVGLKIEAGLQWEFFENWHLGLVLRSPEMDFFYSETEIAYDVELDSDFDDAAYGETESFSEWGYYGGPDLEAQLGLAYQTSRFWIGAEAAFRPPASSYEEWLLNASIGGRFQVRDTLGLGVGIFTDRSTGLEPEWLLDEDTDRYGLCLGGEMRTPIEVKSDKITELVWTTTLALVYSFEIGQVAGVSFDSDFFSETTMRDVVFHQIFVHLGSALYF
jgi:hypothetical protein